VWWELDYILIAKKEKVKKKTSTIAKEINL
jgi:hypothetical protein